MRLRSLLSGGSMIALAMAAVVGSAQDAPPADQEKKEAEEEVIPVKWHSISVGYTTFRTHSTLSRYARPTEGLNIHELSLFNPEPYGRFVVRGMPYRQDSYIAGEIALNRGNTVVRGSRTDYQYNNESFFSVQPSRDEETTLTVDHAIAPNIGAFFLYRSEEHDRRYEAPLDPNHNRSRTVAGGVQGKALGGQFAVTLADRRTFDDTGSQPATLQRRFDISYGHSFGDTFDLEGSYGYTRIEQAGMPSSNLRSYALAGGWEIGPSTSLQFNLGKQELDLNSVLNAYVRRRFTSGARIIQRWPNWSLQFGFRHRESERVRADQSFVDVPKANDFDARLSGKLYGPVRLTLRGWWQDLRETATFQSDDPRQLLWDDKALFQAKLDGGNEKLAAYGAYTYRFQKNSLRDVEIGWSNFVLGGSYVFNEQWSGFAEFSADAYHVVGRAETGQDLDFFFPDSRSFALGLDWAKDANFGASASFNHFESGNVRGSQLTLSLRRRLGPDHDFELIVAPWRHDDRLYDLSSYRTTFLSARFTVRF